MKRDHEQELRTAVHWALQHQRRPITADDRADEDGFVSMQAYSCPHYVPLEGPWGSDWGAIMHPQSAKFGQLVFEHEWCGCGYHASWTLDASEQTPSAAKGSGS